MKWGIYKMGGSYAFEHKPMNVVFDLDGTLANIDHRVPLITNESPEENDWDEFYRQCSDDLPVYPLVHLASTMIRNPNISVEIWTGRSDAVRAQTRNWLRRYDMDVSEEPESSLYFSNVYMANLRMRKDGDFTHDNELKHQWLVQSMMQDKTIAMVFEDRDKVVKMWRANDVICCQVAPGTF